MYDAQTGELFDKNLTDARKKLILGNVWESIVTNGRINMKPMMRAGHVGAFADNLARRS